MVLVIRGLLLAIVLATVGPLEGCSLSFKATSEVTA